MTVHYGSSWVPLRPYQCVTLVPGILISLVPPRSMFRPGVALPLMLLRTEGWIGDPALPADVVGRSFLVLTDTLPSRLDAVHTTRDSFRQDIAVLLRTEVPRLSIQPSLPNLGDYEMLGWQCRGVVAATEQLDRTPIPPGRTRPVRHICFIDQRPLLRGVRWIFAEHGRLGLLNPGSLVGIGSTS